jgi:hypothetical protein
MDWKKIAGAIFVIAVIVIGVVYAQNNSPENNVAWEYDFITFNISNIINGNVNTRGEINQRGRQGWEMVTTIPGGVGSITIVFKRKLP